MATRYIKVSEVVAQLHIDRAFLQQLEAEDLIHLKHTTEGDEVLSGEDVARVRLACMLTSDLDVNLPGVEVIVHMRESMLAMHRQFSEILEALVEEIRRQLVR